MPQMAPMNWVTLYLFFTFLFFMTIVFNYYNFLYKPKQLTYKKMQSKISWKW